MHSLYSALITFKHKTFSNDYLLMANIINNNERLKNIFFLTSKKNIGGYFPKRCVALYFFYQFDDNWFSKNA